MTSTTPRAFFHDMVAGHEDLPDCTQHHHSAVLHQQGFNCHFNDLVASGPFVPGTEPSIVFANFYFKNTPGSTYSSYIQSFFQYKESRGPPSV